MAVALNLHSSRLGQFNKSSQRCRLLSLTNLDFNFLDSNPKQTNLTVHFDEDDDDNFHRSFSTPCFPIASALATFDGNSLIASVPRIEILGGGKRVATIRALVAEVAIAMVSGVQPLLLPSGLGGAYLLQTSKGHDIAVAKPIDEEPLAFNNPKGSGGLMLGQPGMKRSIRVGETGIREVAAYLLDHEGFSSVPPTALVRISHVPFHVSDAFSFSMKPYKVASLQRFVGHDFDAGELGPGSFTVSSVHRIGILDVRVLNLDRHAGNMLVKRQEQDECYNGVAVSDLVPIDHGLCLPECLDDPYFEWLNWPQASVPFTDIELQYISNLDPFKDAELLRSELHSMQESSIRILIVCTIFLKQAAAAGLCLAEIGEKMTRDLSGGEESSSLLEKLCSVAKASVVNEDDDYISEEIEAETEVECGIFQFDDELEDTQEVSQVSSVNAMPAKLSTVMISSPSKWVTHEIEGEESRRKRSIVRSKSHPIWVNHEEIEGICFGDMSSDEWEMFLNSFQMILPEALEESTSQGPKPRFGSSCKF